MKMKKKKFGVKNVIKHIYAISSGQKADKMGKNEEKNFLDAAAGVVA